MSESTPTRSTTPTAHVLDVDELTVLTAWAEGVSEAAAHAPERIDAVPADAQKGATWRAAFGLPQPSPQLGEAMESLGRTVRAVAAPAGTPQFDAMLTALRTEPRDEGRLDGLVRHTLLAMLEERATRRAAPTSPGAMMSRR